MAQPRAPYWRTRRRLWSRSGFLMKGNASLLMLRLVSIVLQLVYIKLYTHYLGAEELGRFFYLIALSYSTNALIFVPLDYYQQARLIDFYEKDIPAKAFLGLNAKAGLIALLILTAVGICFWSFGKIELAEIPQIFLFSLLFHLCTSSRNLLNNLHHRVFVVLMLIMEALLRGGFFWLSQQLLPNTAQTLFQTSIVAYGLEVLAIALFFRAKVSLSWTSSYQLRLHDAIRASYPVSFSAVCNWIQVQAYRLVYVAFGLASIAGIYATVANVGSVGMNAGAQVASQMLNPRLYRSRGDFLYRYLIAAVGLVAVAMLSYSILGPLILRLLTREELVQYWPLLLYGTAVEGTNFVIGIMTTYLTIMQRSRALIYANLLGVITVTTCFYAVYLYAFSNVHYIGLPIIISQIAVCAYLFFIIRSNNRQDSSALP